MFQMLTGNLSGGEWEEKAQKGLQAKTTVCQQHRGLQQHSPRGKLQVKQYCWSRVCKDSDQRGREEGIDLKIQIIRISIFTNEKIWAQKLNQFSEVLEKELSKPSLYTVSTTCAGDHYVLLQCIQGHRAGWQQTQAS